MSFRSIFIVKIQYTTHEQCKIIIDIATRLKKFNVMLWAFFHVILCALRRRIIAHIFWWALCAQYVSNSNTLSHLNIYFIVWILCLLFFLLFYYIYRRWWTLNNATVLELLQLVNTYRDQKICNVFKVDGCGRFKRFYYMSQDNFSWSTVIIKHWAVIESVWNKD